MLVATFAGDYDQALTWAERSFELIGDLKDPDLVADVYASAAVASVARARFREARRLARLHDETTATLTTHHRVHGIAILLELEELAGNWSRIRELEARVVEAVEENLDTPCVRNPRSLLVCALAAELEGDHPRAHSLEARAEELGMEERGSVFEGPRFGLALARGDRESIARLAARPGRKRISTWFGLSADAKRLDGLASIGDRDAVEAEAARHLKPSTYLEPFALRALGVVRQDEELIRQALSRFEEWKLGWHAEQTRALLASLAGDPSRPAQPGSGAA